MRRWISASSSRIFCCSIPVKPLQLHLDDGLRLLLAELETADERIARLPRRASRANQPDHLVQVLEGFLESQQEMLALARLAQLILGAPPDHFDAVLDEVLDDVDEAQFARLPVHDRKHDHAEAGLELGVLIEVVQHHFGLLAALQLEDDAHAVAVALVAYVADALDASSR